MADQPNGSVSGKAFDDNRVLTGEINLINTRRDAGRPLSQPPPGGILDATGLALSGGGIRSAATCLGVLQSLAAQSLLPRIDYLSTVSGGGYLGCSVTVAMSVTGEFPFGRETQPAGAASASDLGDTSQVGHLRNYSNYLMPFGARDVLTALAIVVRGLVANVGLVLPLLLFGAIVTIYSNPKASDLLHADLFGVALKNVPWFVFPVGGGMIGAAIFALSLLTKTRTFTRYIALYAAVIGVICGVAALLDLPSFSITIAGVLVGLVAFLLWALGRSLAYRLSEFRGSGPAIFATYLVMLATIAFLEFQPLMIDAMFGIAADNSSNNWFAGVVAGAITWLTKLTAPIAAAVLSFRQQFGDLLKKEASQTVRGKSQALVARIAIWAASLAVPLLLWIAFLYLAMWGITNDKVTVSPKTCVAPSSASSPLATITLSTTPARGGDCAQHGSIVATLKPETDKASVAALSGSDEAKARDAENKRCLRTAETAHTPCWLSLASEGLSSLQTHTVGPTPTGSAGVRQPIVEIYALLGCVVFLLAWLLAPNANSLHRLYRDRLSKAFLFDPRDHKKMASPLTREGDFRELGDLKLSQLVRDHETGTKRLQGPYPLINTVLNIQGSDYANRRGRNGEFFLFSPLYVGSDATGYIETERFEKYADGLDIGTAMAVSGAAASSNMGAETIGSLTATLTLLNVRLGYWMINPLWIETNTGREPTKSHEVLKASYTYFWSELTGRLYETSEDIYLTDGGHLDNLGLYELLKRRCKLIIAVDAEADPAMNLPSFIRLQRYARIDLGVRIDLPWAPIRKTTKKWMSADETGRDPAAGGPHIAIGTIDYGGDQTGYLVYIKSSLTGDENDAIRDYARRYSDFPHESTGDQFFSEEQFEVYRALGFHMTHRWLSGEDVVAVKMPASYKPPEPAEGKDDKAPPPPAVGDPINVKFTTPDIAIFNDVRSALGMAPNLPPAA